MQSVYISPSKKIAKQYLRCITTIARHDYPQQWPNLLPQIVQYLTLADEKAILAGLLGLHGLVKKYEYEMEEER